MVVRCQECDGVGALSAQLAALAHAANRVALEMLAVGVRMVDLEDPDGIEVREHARELCGAAVQLWDWAEALSARAGGPAELRPAPWELGLENGLAPEGSTPARAITTTDGGSR